MVPLLRWTIGLLPVGLLRFLYTLLYLPAFPLILLYLLRRPDSRQRLREYFGFLNHEAAEMLSRSRKVIWVHGVSVGETLSAIPVVRRLREALPDHDFLLSTTIEDALRLADGQPGLFDARIFLPLDCPPFLDLVIDAVKPRAVLISETDFWPNFLLELKTRKIPVYLLNGRLSDAFLRGFRCLPAFAATVLETFEHFFVQTRRDYDILLQAQVAPEKITVAGNTKYEGGPEGPVPEPVAELLKRLASVGRRILVAGSTHPGEEELMFELLRQQAREADEAMVCILVPRRVARTRRLLRMARDEGFVTQLWSEALAGKALPRHLEIMIVDAMGVLKWIYGCADLIYVGGGFGPGGHNFLEALWHRKAVLCGPDMRNISHDLHLMLSHEGIVQARDRSDLVERALALLGEPEEADAIGRRGHRVLMRQQGASELIAETILSLSFRERDS